MSFFNSVVSAVVGAVAAVANAVVSAVKSIVSAVSGKGSQDAGGMTALGAMATIADVFEDGEIDEDEEELLEEAFKLLVGAFIFPFDSGSSECNSAEEKSTIFDSVGAAVSKSWNSIKEIGHDFWSGMDNRGQKAFDSGYDFANWLGCGVPDVVKETLKSNAERSEKAFDSAYDFSNWISSGSVDMVKETFNPKDPLSKEHWLNSFGTASAIFGIKGTKSTMSSKGGFGVKEELGVVNKGISNSEISRGEYLRNKFGKISSEDLNNYINLKQELKDWIKNNPDELDGVSMTSKVWDVHNQKISDSYTGLSGKSNMNKFLNDVQSRGKSTYIHEDVISGFRELANKKGIELNEDVLANANKGYLSNSDRKYLTTISKEISEEEFWNVLNCGDIRAVNEALIKGANKSDLMGASYNVGKQMFEMRCNNCEITTKGTQWYLQQAEPYK
ncbi:hypothetical protein [Clostridium cagae]|uniref:hypothetical protein n=1 Tax=Clostridium cagae TaxID=2080751 RepID=UPI000CF6A9CC|nr:hypothetical protein [Clostridium cagae]